MPEGLKGLAQQQIGFQQWQSNHCAVAAGQMADKFATYALNAIAAGLVSRFSRLPVCRNFCLIQGAESHIRHDESLADARGRGDRYRGRGE